MKNILVTVDFNEGDKVLINKASELASAFKSKVWIVHIAAPSPDFVGYDVGPQYIRDYRANELREEHHKLVDYTSELKEKSIDAEGLLVQGATIEMVIDEAKRLNADLIIAGYHAHGFIYKALLGSVSTEIIKKSVIPVLIVPLDNLK
nr:universal stress protein [uncultured Carboxylicivirga sp.]